MRVGSEVKVQRERIEKEEREQDLEKRRVLSVHCFPFSLCGSSGFLSPECKSLSLSLSL